MKTEKPKRQRSEWPDTKKDPRRKWMCNLNERHVRFLLSRPSGGSAWLRDRIDEAIVASE